MFKLLSSIYIYFIYTYFIESFLIRTKPNLSHNFIVKYNINQQSNSNKSIIYARNSKSNIIIGGDVEEEPPIVKEVQTEESKSFADKCWDKKINIQDALNLINSEPEKVDDSVLNRLMFNNSTQTPTTELSSTEDSESNTSKEADLEKTKNIPVGTVDLNPIYEDEPFDESTDDEDDEIFLEVDFGLLTYSEVSLILSIMKEKIENPGVDYKPKIIELALGVENLKCNKNNVVKKVNKMSKIANLFLNLNENLGRNPLDLDWIPELETKIYKFIKRKKYTLGTITWIEDSFMVTLKDKNLPEKVVMKLQEQLTEYIQQISLTRSLKGVSNLGVFVSGDDP